MSKNDPRARESTVRLAAVLSARRSVPCLACPGSLAPATTTSSQTFINNSRANLFSVSICGSSRGRQEFSALRRRSPVVRTRYFSKRSVDPTTWSCSKLHSKRTSPRFPSVRLSRAAASSSPLRSCCRTLKLSGAFHSPITLLSTSCNESKQSKQCILCVLAVCVFAACLRRIHSYSTGVGFFFGAFIQRNEFSEIRIRLRAK